MIKWAVFVGLTWTMLASANAAAEECSPEFYRDYLSRTHAYSESMFSCAIFAQKHQADEKAQCSFCIDSFKQGSEIIKFGNQNLNCINGNEKIRQSFEIFQSGASMDSLIAKCDSLLSHK